MAIDVIAFYVINLGDCITYTKHIAPLVVVRVVVAVLLQRHNIIQFDVQNDGQIQQLLSSIPYHRIFVPPKAMCVNYFDVPYESCNWIISRWHSTRSIFLANGRPID